MVIGIDIDDTICDSFEKLLPIICRDCNIDMKSIRNMNVNYEYFFRDKNSPIFKKAVNVLRDNVYDIPIKKDASYYINLLHEMGNRIVFITSRSYLTFDDPYGVTVKYLNNNGIYFDKLITCVSNKVNVCLNEKVDLFIDDGIKHLKGISQAGIDVLLFDASYNNHDNSFKKVNSWKEIYDFVKDKETTTVM